MTAFRLLLLSWAVIIGLASLMAVRDVIITVLPINRLLAFVIVALVILLGVAEMGWGGGDRSI